MSFESEHIFRVVGPPGCGKTTWVARQARRAVDKFGAEGVLLMSLTRAAAREIASRDTGVPDENVGTLHSFCYGLLQRPPMLTSKMLKAWNEKNPHLIVSPKAVGTSGETVMDLEVGSDLLGETTLLRCKRIPFDEWGPQQRDFHQKWEEFKESVGAVEFTDMLERVLEGPDKKPLPPRSASVIFVDEAQDLNALQLEILYMWSKSLDHLILVGDNDQNLYRFIGAKGEAMRGSFDLVLDQSYRVPKKALEVANRLRDRMVNSDVAEFKPTDEEGELDVGGNYRAFTSYLYEEIEPALKAGESVMLLTSCNWMLKDIIDGLREVGLPFWNPYAKRNRRWNPINPKMDGAISTTARVKAYLSAEFDRDFNPMWSVKQVQMWSEMVMASKAFKHGGGATIQKTLDEDKDGKITVRNVLNEIIRPEARSILSVELEDLAQFAKPKYIPQIDYIRRMTDRFGQDQLDKNPNIIVGTIHSVKGGEADRVVVFPDISPKWLEGSGDEEYDEDEILRIFYVGVTRTKRRLVIGAPATRSYLAI